MYEEGPALEGKCGVTRGVSCGRRSRRAGWDGDPGGCSHLKSGRRTEPRWHGMLTKSGVSWPCG